MSRPIHTLPSELYGVLGVPVRDISNLCHSDRHLNAQCHRSEFWRTYLGHDQEKLHQLFVQLGREQDFDLLYYLWNKAQLNMVKEHRSLWAAHSEAFRRAVLEDNTKLIDELWKTGTGNVKSEYGKELTIAGILLTRAAEQQDGEQFVDIYHKFHLSDESEEPGDAPFKVVAEAAAHASSLEFVTKGVMEGIVISDTSTEEIFQAATVKVGNIELIKQIIGWLMKEMEVDEEEAHEYFNPDESKLLESDNPHAMEYLTELYREQGIADEPGPQELQSVFRMNNGQILLDYAQKYPEDTSMILNSYKALPSDQFLALLRSNPNCFSKAQFQRVLKRMEDDGYDYLIIHTKKAITFC